jgi:hypothetical protein
MQIKKLKKGYMNIVDLGNSTCYNTAEEPLVMKPEK